MATLRIEELGAAPISLHDARERLPRVMDYLGYQQIDEENWQRRKDRCGYGFCSLPDKCPTQLHCQLYEVQEEQSRRKTSVRYHLLYHVEMPGQILANTDLKALELEIQRFSHLLTSGFDYSASRKRKRLARLTFLANLFLSILPAGIMVTVLWPLRGWLVEGTLFTSLMKMSVIAVPTWLLSLFLVAKVVVWALNATVKTRLTLMGRTGDTTIRRRDAEAQRTPLNF